jgi:hypothetical protein
MSTIPDAKQSGFVPPHLMFRCGLYDRERHGIGIDIAHNGALSGVARGSESTDSHSRAKAGPRQLLWRFP